MFAFLSRASAFLCLFMFVLSRAPISGSSLSDGCKLPPRKRLRERVESGLGAVVRAERWHRRRGGAAELTFRYVA
jgi:hypothetical protein